MPDRRTIGYGTYVRMRVC